MAALSNGDATATAPIDSPAADMATTSKRKRDDDRNGSEEVPRVRRIQKDILEVLKRCEYTELHKRAKGMLTPHQPRH